MLFVCLFFDWLFAIYWLRYSVHYFPFHNCFAPPFLIYSFAFMCLLFMHLIILTIISIINTLGPGLDWVARSQAPGPGWPDAVLHDTLPSGPDALPPLQTLTIMPKALGFLGTVRNHFWRPTELQKSVNNKWFCINFSRFRDFRIMMSRFLGSSGPPLLPISRLSIDLVDFYDLGDHPRVKTHQSLAF